MNAERTVFISHAWTEEPLYDRVVATINAQLGVDGWKNLSIPKSRAIDPVAEHALVSETARLDRELLSLQARLRDPQLPDAIERWVYDKNGRREVETRGSVKRELDSALERRRTMMNRNPLADSEQWEVSKGIASGIREFPELALAIRERVSQAQYFFVLVSEMLLFRRWVVFEGAVASESSARRVALQFGRQAHADVILNVDEVAEWEAFHSGGFVW